MYEAVELFARRARAVAPDFSLSDETTPPVLEICRRLDGLPLAIELAAARLDRFSPQLLLSRLQDRLGVLVDGPRDVPDRLRSVRGAIDWSYSLLSGEEQTLFARLSLFSGGCTLEAAEAVCNPDGDLDVLETVGSLIEKSLVLRIGDLQPRFWMLETLREYGQDRLRAGGGGERIRELHAEYYRRLPKAHDWPIDYSERLRHEEEVLAELDNIRLALAWFRKHDEIEQEIQLVSAVSDQLFGRMDSMELERRLQDALSRAGTVDAVVRATGLLNLVNVRIELSHFDGTTACCDEALERIS